ncbi:DEAD-box ATP-dependent RNA helicase 5 [Panicum miliaceum]|uniref:RNA helicase n=1 Tax=Panicum miliaceum TaxID=4540 RepID=A0A3L6TBA9_PANMI|nr:DEAD-box ATP-dependent RNA helicase 5 [Panicum miliaceum]
MGRKLPAEQAVAELPRSSKKEKKSKKDKKRKLAAEAEAAVATEEAVAKSSKKKRAEDGPGGGGGGEAENGAEKAVAVTGKGSEDPKYAALRSFSAAELPSQVLDCCKAFARPSPIQAHSWPFLLDGRDLIGIAATGSGKTIAFGVPALMHIRKKVGGKTGKKAVPRCLVLSPTRELAQQIADVLSEAGTPCGINSVCLYGGTSKGPQIAALKSGVDIVIGTPGRMKDLIEMGFCNLNEVSFVVLDEADRMLDLGFEPEVRAILSQTSSVRQMVMFSATWPLAVHKLAQEFMDPNPIKVVIGSEDLAANHDVMQIVEVLDDRSRDSRLLALLDKYHQAQSNRVLVFVLYKKEAARVETMLQRRGWKAVSVHGDKAQHDRTKALSLFKEGKCPLMTLIYSIFGFFAQPCPLNTSFASQGWAILVESHARCSDQRFKTSKNIVANRIIISVLIGKLESGISTSASTHFSYDVAHMIATDVASRGLDIPDVEVVINYSYPLTTEDYVHRIGRTGRAGKKGVAHTFFTQENKGLAGELVNVLREAGQVVPPALMKFGTHVKKKESKIYGSHFKEITADAPKSTKITFGDSDED